MRTDLKLFPALTAELRREVLLHGRVYAVLLTPRACEPLLNYVFSFYKPSDVDFHVDIISKSVSCCILRTIMSQYAFSFSINTHLRPKSLAALPVVPEPAYGSRIMSSGLLYFSMHHFINGNGFCVGCQRCSLSFILPCNMPCHLYLNIRTADLKFVHASSQSAKSVSPFSLSHTIQHDDGGS